LPGVQRSLLPRQPPTVAITYSLRLARTQRRSGGVLAGTGLFTLAHERNLLKA
jgi:hypothetical protein